jgi:hypothetical protein
VRAVAAERKKAASFPALLELPMSSWNWLLERRSSAPSSGSLLGKIHLAQPLALGVSQGRAPYSHFTGRARAMKGR